MQQFIESSWMDYVSHDSDTISYDAGNFKGSDLV